MVPCLANFPLFPTPLRLANVSIVFVVPVPTIFVVTGPCLTGAGCHIEFNKWKYIF